MSSTLQRLEPRIRARTDDAAFAFVGVLLAAPAYRECLGEGRDACVAVTPRQGTALAVPKEFANSGVLTPEAYHGICEIRDMFWALMNYFCDRL